MQGVTMSPGSESPETILIVDDEESVRRTFREWLEAAGLGCRIFAASDAESALVQANQHVIDLAVLDWNLGAGTDGLQLLEDLTQFSPDVVAIMVTGFAHQATPLQAMRMGVRDYLDKNQDLNRDTFIRAVRRQLERIRPARQARRIHQALVGFRGAVEKVLPLVRTATALHDPLPLPGAIKSLFRFALGASGASAGVLLVRGYDANRTPAEVCRAYSDAGDQLAVDLVPFARSIAGSVVSMQQSCVMERLDQTAARGAVELQPFEVGRSSLLAAPLNVSAGWLAVLELFDKPGGFTEGDRQLAASVADFGAELLRQALAERQTKQVLFDAVAAALESSDSVLAASQSVQPARPEDPPPEAVLDRLRAGLADSDAVSGAEAIRLAEAVRVLALQHGPRAVQFCIDLAERLRGLLDGAAGMEEARP
jgi:ActR/RegA family two-component response regulator